jgi:hypothetical protein
MPKVKVFTLNFRHFLIFSLITPKFFNALFRRGVTSVKGIPLGGKYSPVFPLNFFGIWTRDPVEPPGSSITDVTAFFFFPVSPKSHLSFHAIPLCFQQALFVFHVWPVV